MTKTVDIFTIANALLDSEFTVSAEFIQAQQLTKGIAHLVDTAAHQTLSEQLGEPKLVAAGGACANSIYAAASLGGKCAITGRVGEDQAGAQLLASLAKANIILSEPKLWKAPGSTGQCFVLLTDDADRTMVTHLGVSSQIEVENIDLDLLRKSRYLLIEGYQCSSSQANASSNTAIKAARQADVNIAVSVCDEFIAEQCREQFLAMLGQESVDIIFCNQFEAMKLTEQPTVSQAIDKLLVMAKRCVVTQGAQGAMIATANDRAQISAPKVTAIDTLGAGDQFVGTCLFALNQGLNLAAAAQFAVKTCAELVQHFGPRLPSEKLQQLWLGRVDI